MSRPGRIRLMALVTALAVGAGTALASAAPAAAAPRCWSSSGTGENPQNQGCSRGSRTIDEFSYLGVRFELRYSDRCHAAWTRVTSRQHFNTLFGQIRGGGHIYGVQATEGQHWTKMISFNYRVRSCRAVWFNAKPNECTTRH
jgi:Protein of unknown function (DUF2690)